MKAPINSIKHIVQQGIDTVMGGTMQNITVVNAVSNPDGDISVQCEQGSIIKAIYFEMWLLAGSQQPGSITVTCEKVIANVAPMTFLQGSQLYTYPNKKNILYTTQGLTPDANGNPIPFIRQWIKIPRGKQRFGLNDKINFNIQANVEDATHCGLFIYKEYK